MKCFPVATYMVSSKLFQGLIQEFCIKVGDYFPKPDSILNVRRIIHVLLNHNGTVFLLKLRHLSIDFNCVSPKN